MDNVSHSLAGLAIGELIDRCLPPEPDQAAAGRRRRMLLVSAWLAANLPDLDLVLTGLLPKPLGYLLHHRGHTHTALLALVQALALMLLVWLLWPAARRLLQASKNARTGLAMAAGTGLASHLLLDYLNSYGVHPFWPFDGRWIYGDMVFIVEPVFWFAFGVPLIAMIRNRYVRWAWLAFLPAFLAWASTKNYLHWSSVAGLAALAALLFLVQKTAPPRSWRGVAAGMAIAAGFIGLQGWASSHGKQMLAAQLRQQDPAARLLDAALTPFPASPACWNFATIEISGSSYRLRRGVLSTMPALIPQPACPLALNLGTVPATPAFAFSMEAAVPLAELRAQARNCHFSAWLRFARLPYLSGGTALDARFSNQGGNFTSFDIARFASLPCPASVPGWDMPRQDLLLP